MITNADCADKYRVWAEVDTANIAYNYGVVRSLAPRSEVMPVIKANAYGHGAPETALALAGAGARIFAVACPYEALELRERGIAQPILVMGDTPAAAVPELAARNIAITLSGFDLARGYSAVLGDMRIGAHIKLDSGMRRSGLDITGDISGARDEFLTISAMPCFNIEGVFTHFAVADNGPGDPFTIGQLKLFNDFCAAAARGLPRHCAGSAGIIYFPESHTELVRPGIMLYGYDPVSGAVQSPGLRPALSLKTAIRQIRHINKGDGVSYGLIWKSRGRRTIATLSVGYADGLMRCLSGKINVLLRGCKAPQVGRICMDMCMIDVTDIPGAAIGDVATLIGSDGREKFDAADMGGLVPTIPHEILCAISGRVPRIYI